MAASSDPKNAATGTPVKLHAGTRRKSASAPARRGKRKSASARKGGGVAWMPILLAVGVSAAAGYYWHDPAAAQTQVASLGTRVSAAREAFTSAGEPKAKSGQAAPKATASASTTAEPAAKAEAPKPKVEEKAKLAALAAPKANAKETPASKAKAPASGWTAAEEKELFNALGKRNQEAFRRLVRQHNSVLPRESGLGQDILAAAVARGKSKDVEFMLASGLSADRVLEHPAGATYLNLAGNSTLKEAASTERNITLLMVAAARGDAELIQLLQRQGARNRSTSNRRFTALDFAVSSNKPEAIQACLGRRPGDESSRIIISLKERTATFMQDGRIRERSWVSTGKGGHSTPTGRFVVTQKHKEWTSNRYHVEMPYFLRLNNGPIGLHAGKVPPYPASHGCIRLPDEQARSFFQMADIGTIVDIVN